MGCHTPLKAYRTRIGEKGKVPEYGISFKENDPSAIYETYLPCGRCIGCRLERSRQWAVRCIHEAQTSGPSCFITLTYNQQNLPKGGTLKKDHFVDFMKRLRKKFVPKNPYHPKLAPKSREWFQYKYGIRYFMCGEYGDEESRPHYHACLFNIDLPDKKHHKMHRGNPYYTSEILDDLWENKGWCYISDVTFESAAYVARYCTKKINGPSSEKHYNGREPEYSTQSSRPAIGLKWIERYYEDVYSSDCVRVKGRGVRAPRYYDKYIEKFYSSLYNRVKEKRENVAMLFAHTDEADLERMLVKHKLQVLRMSKLKRSYENQREDYKPLLPYDEKALEYNALMVNNRRKI